MTKDVDSPRHPVWFELRQMLGLQFGQDWMHDFEDGWEAGEQWVVTAPRSLPELLVAMERFVHEIPDQQQRFEFFEPIAEIPSVFRDAEEFDAWFRAMIVRIPQALAGDHSQPLVDPDPEPWPDLDQG